MNNIAKQNNTAQLRAALLIFIALLFFNAATEAQTVKPDDPSLVLEKLVTAFEQQDINLHEQIWVQNENLNVIGVFNNSNYFGWINFRKHLTGTFAAAKKITIKLIDQKLSLGEDKNNAWFYMVLDESIELPGKTIRLDNMRYTGVIVKTNDKWRITQFHGSLPFQKK